MKEQSTMDRLPPHDLGAEAGVISCCLISPNDSLADLVSHGVSGEWFYDIRHREVYKLLVSMFDSRVAIDLVTVASQVSRRDLVEKIGGMVYLATLSDAAPSAANLSYYLDTVKDLYTRRKLIRTCADTISLAYDSTEDTDKLVDEAERGINTVADAGVKTGIKTAKELVMAAVERVEFLHSNQGALTGLATGFCDLDKKTCGLQSGELIIIAGRPATGKTSIAMNIAEHVCLELKLPVGVFSLEMTAESLILRMMASNARVNLRNLNDGFLTDRDFKKLSVASGRLSVAPLCVDDTSTLSILQLRAKARRMHQSYGIRLFVVDYLQLLHSTNRKSENRQQEVADISGGLKALSKELNVPVIVLSQLNREIEKDKARKPRLSDLRESGSQEQDGDIVGLLYHPDTKDDGVMESDTASVNLLIAKNRNGPVGDIRLTFMKTLTRFESAARVSQEDVPPDSRYPDS